MKQQDSKTPTRTTEAAAKVQKRTQDTKTKTNTIRNPQGTPRAKMGSNAASVTTTNIKRVKAQVATKAKKQKKADQKMQSEYDASLLDLETKISASLMSSQMGQNTQDDDESTPMPIDPSQMAEATINKLDGIDQKARKTVNSIRNSAASIVRQAALDRITRKCKVAAAVAATTTGTTTHTKRGDVTHHHPHHSSHGKCISMDQSKDFIDVVEAMHSACADFNNLADSMVAMRAEVVALKEAAISQQTAFLFELQEMSKRYSSNHNQLDMEGANLHRGSLNASTHVIRQIEAPPVATAAAAATPSQQSSSSGEKNATQVKGKSKKNQQQQASRQANPFA
jgi:hypothetical protein